MIEFGTVILLTLGLGLFLAGIFTAYFGRGKSRMVGITLLIVGIIIWIGTYAIHHGEILNDDVFMDALRNGLYYVGAFVIGALIAVAIFLVAIMKT